jgi:hypothetical protein
MDTTDRGYNYKTKYTKITIQIERVNRMNKTVLVK